MPFCYANNIGRSSIVNMKSRNVLPGCKQRKLGLAFICLLAALPANGHAILKESLPAPHSVISGPEITIRLKFNSRIDAEHSRLSLDRDSHSQKITIVAQTMPDTLVGQAKGVSPGEYQLEWQVLAIDGHITRGQVPFTVR